MTEILLSIDVGIDPNIVKIGGLLITWHGFFTAAGIIAGVWLAVRIAESERVNIDADTAYTLGMVIVACGLVGARLLYVAERYGDSSSLDSIPEIFKITEGGISIYGAIIGGAIGGWAWGLWKKLPCAAGADAAVFGMLLGMAIGRLGDIINGEHFAKTTDLPWGITYSHPNSPGFFREPMHPAVGYELIGDLVIIGVLALAWRWRPKPGVIFALGFLIYAVMRFGLSFLRTDSKTIALGLTTPEVVSLLVIAVALPLLIFFWRRKAPEAHERPEQPARRGRQLSRAERRRRLRAG